MSIFGKVIGERKASELASKLENARIEKARTEAHEQAKQAFKVNFVKAWETIAMPLFEAFVKDAKAHGYDAKMTEFGRSVSQFGGTIRLMTVLGEPLPIELSEQVCVFVLSGEPYDQIVTLGCHFERHIKKNPVEVGGHNMMCKEKVEAALEKFLNSAIDGSPCHGSVGSELESIPAKLNAYFPKILFESNS